MWGIRRRAHAIDAVGRSAHGSGGTHRQRQHASPWGCGCLRVQLAMFDHGEQEEPPVLRSFAYPYVKRVGRGLIYRLRHSPRPLQRRSRDPP